MPVHHWQAPIFAFEGRSRRSASRRGSRPPPPWSGTCVSRRRHPPGGGPVLRADFGVIIAAGANVQDGAVLNGAATR